MSKSIEVSASILAADFSKLGVRDQTFSSSWSGSFSYRRDGWPFCAEFDDWARDHRSYPPFYKTSLGSSLDD